MTNDNYLSELDVHTKYYYDVWTKDECLAYLVKHYPSYDELYKWPRIVNNWTQEKDELVTKQVRSDKRDKVIDLIIAAGWGAYLMFIFLSFIQ